MYAPGSPDVCLVDLAGISLEAVLAFSQREIKVQSFLFYFIFFGSVCEILNMLLARPLDYMAVGKRSSPAVPWCQG